MNSVTTPTIDLGALKRRQQATWASGDYAAIGTTLQIVGEQLCETIALRPGAKVLDVAAGNGNATLAAARRFADVTSTDYVPALLARGEARAAAEGLPVRFQVEDAEDLSFADASFDIVLSTFGVMFTADHERAARELVRVCRRGGTIAMANWTPDGFIGRMFRTIGAHVPPPPGARSPALWGSEAGLAALFPGAALELRPRSFVFRYRSAEHFIEHFRSWYGPVHKAFLALGDGEGNGGGNGGDGLAADMRTLIGEMNDATDGTMAVPSAYVEAIVRPS